jgi:chorismate synthase
MTVVCSSCAFHSLPLQKTVTRDGQEVELRGKGRHDPCVLPRAVPMVEAMVALTLVDALMLQQAQCTLFPNEAAVEDQPNPMGSTARRTGGARRELANAAPSGPVSQRVDEE